MSIMNYKSIFNVVVVVAVLIATGCVPSKLQATYVPTPEPPPPQPRVSTPPPVKPFVPYKMKRDTLTEDHTLIDEDKYISSTPKFLITSTIADLEVSDKKVTGSSTGPIVAREIMKNEAVAKAIAQKDGADVLIGYTFFYRTASVKERTTRLLENVPVEHGGVTEKILVEPYLTVTVTGYPARYVNFRPYNGSVTDSQYKRSDTTLKSGPVVPPVISTPQLAPR